MEELTKSQLILVALLVSFVTSIATGIVTVTLVNQAPTDVVRTINRVVERTVEKVVPGETKIIEKIAGPVESDLISDAASSGGKALAFLSGDGVSQGAFFISENLLFTNGARIYNDGSYLLKTNATNTPYKISIRGMDKETNIALIEIKNAEAASVSMLSVQDKNVSLGEKVIVLGLDEKLGPFLRLGNVTAFKAGNASSTPIIFTNLPDSDSIVGLPALNLNGELIGVYVGAYGEAESAIVPNSYFRRMLPAKDRVGDSGVQNSSNAANAISATPAKP